MVRCDGEDGGLPSGLRNTLAGTAGEAAPEGSVPLVSERVHPPLLLSGPPRTLKSKEMVLPSSRLGLQPRGLLQVRLALDQEYAAFGNHCTPDSGIGSVGEAQGTGPEWGSRPQPLPPDAIPAAHCAAALADTPSFLLPPFLVCLFQSSFLPCWRESSLRASESPPLKSICTKSSALVGARGARVSVCVCVCKCACGLLATPPQRLPAVHLCLGATGRRPRV